MKNRDSIPEATVERLPLYYRYLDKLLLFENIEVVSSKELGGKLGIAPTQVRKDLSYYGEFGRRGVGYDVQELKKSLGKILGVDKMRPAVLVGAGNLGTALVNYKGFQKMGLNICCVLDDDPDKIGQEVAGIGIEGTEKMADFISAKGIKVGIISVPAGAAQDVADKLVEAGIKAIWNFAPTRLYVPDGVIVRNEDLAVGIVSLIYHLSEAEEQQQQSES